MLAGAGVAVVLVLVVAVVLADSDTTPPTGAATSRPAVTVSPATVTTTPPPAAGEVVFRDKFSSRAAGWEGDPGAAYADGAYRISAPPSQDGGGAGSVPTKAGDVFPSAPPRIRITVQARRLPASDTSMSYGILCRTTGSEAYVLTVSDNYAKIEQWGDNPKLLKEASPQVDPNARNKLQAVCSGGSGRQPVRLELSVNGQMVVATTDREDPIPPAAVGVAVGTYQTTRASVAEFDDFVVEQVA